VARLLLRLQESADSILWPSAKLILMFIIIPRAPRGGRALARAKYHSQWARKFYCDADYYISARVPKKTINLFKFLKASFHRYRSRVGFFRSRDFLVRHRRGCTHWISSTPLLSIVRRFISQNFRQKKFPPSCTQRVHFLAALQIGMKNYLKLLQLEQSGAKKKLVQSITAKWGGQLRDLRSDGN
jgi:hypothetical protein